MQKGIFLHFNSDKNMDASGEIKKVKMQIKALKKLGLESKEFCIDKSGFVNKFTRRIPLYPASGIRLIKKIGVINIQNSTFIYIRKYIIDFWFLQNLKEIKRINPDIKILLEIPTYPYDMEWNRLLDKTMLWKEKHNREKMEAYVDRIITLTKDSSIFGIPTIKISNGIDTDDYTVVKKIKDGSATLILIGVALVSKWHGYDRIIRGLKEYYQCHVNMKVIFWIVGDGPVLQELQSLVQSYNLEEYVLFKGKATGRELENLYNKADIAVGSLGFYRIGLEQGSSLKLREYCAKGIPFIKANFDEQFDQENFKYMLTFPNDDSLIDINKIIEFYEIINNDLNVQQRMHIFAEEHLTWEQQMRAIKEYLEN